MALINPVYAFIVPFLIVVTVPLALLAGITTTIAFSVLITRVVVVYIDLAIALLPQYIPFHSRAHPTPVSVTVGAAGLPQQLHYQNVGYYHQYQFQPHYQRHSQQSSHHHSHSPTSSSASLASSNNKTPTLAFTNGAHRPTTPLSLTPSAKNTNTPSSPVSAIPNQYPHSTDQSNPSPSSNINTTSADNNANNNNPTASNPNSGSGNASNSFSARRRRRPSSASIMSTGPASSASSSSTTTPGTIGSDAGLALMPSVGMERDFEGVGGWRLGVDDDSQDPWTTINSRFKLPDRYQNHHAGSSTTSIAGVTGGATERNHHRSASAGMTALTSGKMLATTHWLDVTNSSLGFNTMSPSGGNTMTNAAPVTLKHRNKSPIRSPIGMRYTRSQMMLPPGLTPLEPVENQRSDLIAVKSDDDGGYFAHVGRVGLRKKSIV